MSKTVSEPCRIGRVASNPHQALLIATDREDPPVCGEPVVTVFSTGWRACEHHAVALRRMLPFIAIPITEEPV